MSSNKRKFTNLSFGLFIHYGLYSSLGKGERIKEASNISDEEYDKLALTFNPKKDFADEICSFAKRNGFKYVVLTTRHHDGFSLYDCSKINTFNSMHYIKRDLVREFVDACKKYGLVPFLYHTLIDWREEKKYKTFSEYLSYLRKSIDILCSNYGEIGGFWFDGQWKYPNADWEEDNLYNLIREKQPNALITNNAGLSRLGERFSNLIDIVTYERNNVTNYNYDEDINNYATEMCQALNSHWGYAEKDLDYKTIKEVLYSLCISRKYGGNFLLNVGPLGDGSIRSIEKDIISFIGDWVKENSEALYLPKPYNLSLPQNCFALKNENFIYIFILDVPMESDENVGKYNKNPTLINLNCLNIEKAEWLDTKEKIKIINNTVTVPPYPYGTSRLVRIAKIKCK